MQAVHFNRGSTLISAQSNISLMRSSILIADKVWFSPSDQTIFQHKKLFLDNLVNVTFKSKLKIFEMSSREHFSNQLDENLDNTINNIPLILKDLKKIKHPTPNVLKDIKKLEKVVNDIYLQISTERQEKFEELGMVQLEDFIGKSFFENIDHIENEKPPTGDFINHDLYDILKLDFKKRTGIPFIFSLIGEMSNEDIFPKYCALQDEESKDKNSFWLDDLIDITGLECLSTTDLEIIRDTVAEERKVFNEAMDKWICESRKDSLGFDGLLHYQQAVKEAAQKLNDALWSVPMMEAFKDFKARFILRIGEIPLKTLWKYFYQAKCIEVATFERLMKEMKNPSFAGRWPVFALGIKNNLSNKILTHQELMEKEIDNIPNKRKVINLD